MWSDESWLTLRHRADREDFLIIGGLDYIVKFFQTILNCGRDSVHLTSTWANIRCHVEWPWIERLTIKITNVFWGNICRQLATTQIAFSHRITFFCRVRIVQQLARPGLSRSNQCAGRARTISLETQGTKVRNADSIYRLTYRKQVRNDRDCY